MQRGSRQCARHWIKTQRPPSNRKKRQTEAATPASGFSDSVASMIWKTAAFSGNKGQANGERNVPGGRGVNYQGNTIKNIGDRRRELWHERRGFR